MSHLPNNQMASGSDLLYSTKPELSGLKNHNNKKIISEYESAWSPTSPLDFKMLFVNPFGGGSTLKGHQKSWDSCKVGLSIVDSLDDHHRTDSSRFLLSSPDSKNIIFGSSFGNPKPHLPCPVVEELPVLSQPFVKSPVEKDDKLKVDLIELDSSYCSGEENISVNNNACQVIKQAPVSLYESDIEISEDYTCVISHGPNPKTTHFYGDDKVLESVEHNGLDKLCCGNKKESTFVIAPLDFTATPTDVLTSNDFLSFCCSCNKKLDMGKDIYMYRGYKAFCSSECRSEEIQLDDKAEEGEEDKDEEEAVMSKKKSNSVIFTIG